MEGFIVDSIVGIIVKDWFALLRENKFNISPRYALKAAYITILSIKNSVLKKKEENIFREKLQKVEINNHPLFIIGHWRSGTTFLHNLLSLDERFLYPRVWQVNNPHTFLFLEEKVEATLLRMGQKERPMDRVIVSRFSPGEEEFALAVLSLKSPMLGWMFPQKDGYYERYLTFKHVAAEEVTNWQQNYLRFCRKLSFRKQKQLLLKSPPNTARIKLLLDIFPEAKFVHIHRNPFRVFQSTRKLFQTAIAGSALQKSNHRFMEEKILRQYQELYEAYFEQKNLIPDGNLLEIKFNQLKKNPLQQLKKIYDLFNIPDFTSQKPRFEQYLQSVSAYQQNVYEPIESAVKERIVAHWKRCFYEWDYTLN